MADKGNTRRLAAILAADVVDYSRLMHEDEDATIAAWQAARQDIIDPIIAEHEGRIVKHTGDGFLAEFSTVRPAVRCAVALQEALADSALDFRMGVNLGDIVADEDDIHGDGVNIAARLEGLADPGGIFISGSVHDQVHNRLDLAFEDLGEQQVKNIAKPVRVYRIVLGQVATGTFPASSTKSSRWPVVAAVGVVVIALAAGLFAWQPWVTRVEPASVEKMRFPLPEKPSIAVLPFDNLSGDPKQEYFSDGMTESIITALSKIPRMFVIAPNSTFTYKGKAVKVQKVAEELGVRYVLEGSMQRSENRVRITAQLIDALTGRHIWAEQYDRELKDIFALQDDVAQNVVTALEVKLTEGEQARLWRGQTTNTEAYEYFVRGGDLFRRLTKADNAESRRLMEKALALDPGFAAAWIGVARTLQLDAQFGWTTDRRQSMIRARKYVQKSLALDDTQAESYAVMSRLALIAKQHDQALAHCNKAFS